MEEERVGRLTRFFLSVFATFDKLICRLLNKMLGILMDFVILLKLFARIWWAECLQSLLLS